MTDAASPDLIVCATDFSPEAASALEWAAAFARREGGRIDLVHVVPEPTRNREAAGDGCGDVRGGAPARRARAARARSPPRPRARPASWCSRRSSSGTRTSRIVEHARGHRARLIVMGASSRPAIDRWVLGSAAERTVRSASVPVAVVPRREAGAALVRAGTGRRRAAVQGRWSGSKAMISRRSSTFAAGLRRRGACDVTFLHLYWPIEEYERLGLARRRAIRSRRIRRW